ncbi:MAG: deoxyribonuclease IV [Patescibacteria group bacterium]
MNRPKIGGHVSAAGGLVNAVLNAQAIGAECFQIFGASPRQWSCVMPSRGEIEKYKDALSKSGIGPVYLHAAYLVNLASPDNDAVARSIKSLIEHLEIAHAIGAAGLVYHMGSTGKDFPKEQAMDQVAHAMKKVLSGVPGKTKLLMENAAGGGTKLGVTPEELGIIFRKVESDRTGVCFDTAHGFEAGIIDYTPKSIKSVFSAFDKEIGLENLPVLHVNDSKTGFDSRNDKHENIGDGHIGIEKFRNLAREKRLRDKAWILEVPGFDKEGPDARNIDILHSLFA